MDVIQDSSSTHFRDDPIPKFVRAILQNSLDANERDLDSPVEVEITERPVDPKIIGAGELQKHLESCLDRAKGKTGGTSSPSTSGVSMITRTIEPLPKSTQRTHMRFRTWITPVLISGIILLLLVACDQADNPDSLTYPASPQWPEKTPAMEADNPDSLTYPYFPKLVEQRSVMEARTQGELVLENGCIRLKDMGNTDYLLIWPPRFELTVDGEDIRIRDDSGMSLSVGETIILN